jgi:hypothetical protein
MILSRAQRDLAADDCVAKTMELEGRLVSVSVYFSKDFVRLAGYAGLNSLQNFTKESSKK